MLNFAPRMFTALLVAFVVLSGCREPAQPEPPAEPPTPQSPLRN